MEYRALAVGITYELYDYLKTYLMDGDIDLTLALTVTQGIPTTSLSSTCSVQKKNRLELLVGLH